MKSLPPELIETISYILTTALGWFLKWLQGRNSNKKKDNIINQLQNTNNALINRIKTLKK